MPWPADVALVAILRDTRVIVPTKDDPLEVGDELLFVATDEVEDQLDSLLSGAADRDGYGPSRPAAQCWLGISSYSGLKIVRRPPVR